MAQIKCEKCGKVFDAENSQKVFCAFCGAPCENKQDVVYATPVAVTVQAKIPENATEMQVETTIQYNSIGDFVATNGDSTPTTVTADSTKKTQNKKLIGIIIAVVGVTLAVILAIVGIFVIKPIVAYNSAQELLANGDYDGAYDGFEALGSFKDSPVKLLECNYLNATELYNSGDYQNAYEKFLDARDYSDSTEMADKSLFHIQKETIKNASVGQVVEFGVYEQDNDTANGAEILEWIVLDSRGDQKLIITKQAIDTRQYDSRDMYLTWSECGLRQWLNNEFIDTAFSPERQSVIMATKNVNYSNYFYGTNGGADTTDSVFLLSTDEAGTYFKTDNSRKAEPTAYAAAKGADTEYGSCWWLLRTPGIKGVDICGVHKNGEIDYLGCFVYSQTATVRPAMWVNAED